jgi:hypothetical protein
MSLHRIAIPFLVEIISRGGFWGYTSLNEFFASDCQLKQIDGFAGCA